jgi:predicted nucleotidyltransferase
MSANDFGIKRIGIFGSVARGENTEDSDIDIVVEIDKPTLVLIYNLKETLKSIFNCDVDLVHYRNSLRSTLKSNIEKEAIYV